MPSQNRWLHTSAAGHSVRIPGLRSSPVLRMKGSRCQDSWLFRPSLYLSGMVDTVLLHTPTRSSSSLSQISAVAGEVAMILGSPSSSCTFFFAASTAAFSFGSVIFNNDSADSEEVSALLSVFVPESLLSFP